MVERLTVTQVHVGSTPTRHTTPKDNMKVTNWKTIAAWCRNLTLCDPAALTAAIEGFTKALPEAVAWNDQATLAKINGMLLEHRAVMEPFTSSTQLGRFRLLMIALQNNQAAVTNFIPAGFSLVNWGTVKPTFHEYVDAQATVSRFVAGYPGYLKELDRQLKKEQELLRKATEAATAPRQLELPLPQSEVLTQRITALEGEVARLWTALRALSPAKP